MSLASLPRPRFRRALEVGCSVGVLTSDLAPRCDELLALDVAGAAVALASERTRALPSVRVEQMAVPAQWPEGTFDLVVLSEVGYYLSLDELTSLCDRSIGSLSPDGVLVACHWRHPVEDTPCGATRCTRCCGPGPRWWRWPATRRRTSSWMSLSGRRP